MDFQYTPSPFMLPTSHYDKKRADHAVAFIQNLKHTKGKWDGKPFLLLPWQEQIVRDIFGIVKADGKVVHDSGILSPKVGMQTVDIPLKGVRVLELSIDPTADGASGDQVTWIAPRIEYQGGMPELVDAHTTDEGPMQSQATIDCLRGKINRLPLWEALPSDKTTFDWLLTPEKSEAGIYRSADGKGIVIANGMVSRTFRVMPNLATVGYTNRMLGESMLRAVSGEGTLWIDGKKWEINNQYQQFLKV